MRRAAWWTVLGAGGAAAGTLVIALTQSPFAGTKLVGSMITTGFWLLKLLVAAHTVYFLHEIRRNGMLELLLVTPVAGVRMWNGHIAAVRGVFLWPFLVLALMEVSFGIGVKVAQGGDWPSRAMMVLAGGSPAVISALINGLDCFAIAYHAGRWALHYDRPGKALLRTVVLVVVLPVVLCSSGRFLVDLLVISAVAGELNRFRELARNSFLPRTEGTSAASASVSGLTEVVRSTCAEGPVLPGAGVPAGGCGRSRGRSRFGRWRPGWRPGISRN
jgi:uncharacterized membrane protein YhaH (DUF805 family)